MSAAVFMVGQTLSRRFCARVPVLLGSVMALFALGCTTGAQMSASADADTMARAVHATRPGVTRMPSDTPSHDPARFLEPFPPAAPGQIRWVIALPTRAHEDQIQVELLPSIRMHTDCNHHLASAKVERHVVQGWGYGYQVMADIGPVISTLMGCPADAARERDVPVDAGLSLERYNSRAPIVFYTPAQVTLRYRLWRVEGQVQSAVQR